MAELLIALTPLLALAGLSLLAIYVPLVWLGGFALSLMLVGFVSSVPSGLYYHVLLRRELTRDGPAPKGWYWHPQRYHDAIEGDAARRLQRWFMIGATGFALVVLGFLLSVLTLLLWFRAGN